MFRPKDRKHYQNVFLSVINLKFVKFSHYLWSSYMWEERKLGLSVCFLQAELTLYPSR